MKRFSGLVIIFKNYQKLSLYMTNLLLCNLTELTIHLSSSAYPGPGCGGSSLRREAHHLQLVRGNTMAFPDQPRDIISSVFWVCPRWDMPGTPRPGGIFVRCSNHLKWPLSMCRSSGSTLRPSRMAEPSLGDKVFFYLLLCIVLLQDAGNVETNLHHITSFHLGT